MAGVEGSIRSDTSYAYVEPINIINVKLMKLTE